MTHRTLFRTLAVVALLVVAPGTARAFEPFALLVPCRATAVNSVGTTRPCITCHDNPDGGAGCDMPPCFNPFGTAFDMNGRMWDTTLALLDSDGDGYTNGQELGDPMGTWRAGMATPDTCECATRPGFSASTPGDADLDEDRFCCIGADTNRNGTCLDMGESSMGFDCDEMNEAANSGAMEICSNTVDNDCDGFPTLLDSDCANVVDRDGDGYCPMGLDMNRDRDCIDSGEMTSDRDCDDDQVTVSPAAGENCLDGLDNDCDMMTDTADADCTSDRDADGDGYCPIGRDTNGNGNCNDAGEMTAGYDCDDGSNVTNSGATEQCTDFADNDCDGLADFRDDVDCGAFFDGDMDGYCPAGRDGNGNGNCVDPGEAEGPGDCDDGNPAINPGLTEQCLDADVDEDCDVQVSLADSDCAGYIDTDGDTFCFVGADMDADGTCTDTGEQSGDGDCDEASVEVRPTATEVCVDGVDNDCDGSTDGAERGTCDAFRDIDGDGWCVAGEDLDDDGYCDDAGEQGDVGEWTAEEDPFDMGGGSEDSPVRYPGAPEHCRNRVDEDLDGMVDEAAACPTDVDADRDGFCPVGTDANGDGDCEDEDENRGLDCNDGDASVNTGGMERCLEPVDADCDGNVGTRDEDCFYLLDLDGDGLCGTGIDDNSDGDCLDESEDRFGADCDERDPAVNSRAREAAACDDGIDNDCDGAIDFDDTQCVCEMDADCDDGDACTVDACADEMCTHTPDSTCGDGGMPADAGGMTGGGDCGCRAVGSTRAPIGLALIALVALVRARRRR